MAASAAVSVNAFLVWMNYGTMFANRSRQSVSQKNWRKRTSPMIVHKTLNWCVVCVESEWHRKYRDKTTQTKYFRWFCSFDFLVVFSGDAKRLKLTKSEIEMRKSIFNWIKSIVYLLRGNGFFSILFCHSRYSVETDEWLEENHYPRESLLSSRRRAIRVKLSLSMVDFNIPFGEENSKNGCRGCKCARINDELLHYEQNRKE